MKFFKRKIRPEIQKLFDYIENNQEKIKYYVGIFEISLPENGILKVFFDGDMYIHRREKSPLLVPSTSKEREYGRKLYNSLIKKWRA